MSPASFSYDLQTDLSRGFGLRGWRARLRAASADPDRMAGEIRREAEALLELANRIEAPDDDPVGENLGVESTAFFRSRGEMIWGQNPTPGTELASGLKIFHDAGNAVFDWRQHPVGGGNGRYGLSFTVYDFDGEFLSLVIEIPEADGPRIDGHKSLILSFNLFATRPLTLYARLNFQRETDTATLHDAMIVREGAYVAEFNMEEIEFDLRTGTSVWVDLIFSRPAMAEFEISGLRLTPVDAENEPHG